MAKQLNVNLAFTADTGKAKAQLQDLQRQLDLLMKKSVTTTDGLGLTKDLMKATEAAGELKMMLEAATTPTGKLDLGAFNQAIQKSGRKLSDYAADLNSLGADGQKAFANIAKAISTAEMPLRRTNSLLSEFAVTLKNTARWQISSSILHGFMGTVQSAYGYAQDLNESLNNIRIVTGQNSDEMAEFAKNANKAAKELSTTTTAYTNAALIYYQQGDDDATVLEKTDVTTKMANVTGQEASVVSDQLTAIWNNFNKTGEESYEKYADILTALGAETASSTDEIAGGLEKFASIADMIGLSYEYAATALATITATTRQSEDVVGTALKTIFARIQGLNLGETLDDGTTLNKYSEALEKVGISIFEQNGELKNMDSILDEMGAKWKTLSDDQQVALAQTVAGVRQYNQLVSLMDNWDYFGENLAIAEGAEGELDRQAETYAESWEAARKRVQASAQSIYQTLIDDDFFIGLSNTFADLLSVIKGTIDGLGGLPGVLTLISSLMLQSFGPGIADSINNTFYNLTYNTQTARDELRKLREDAVAAMASLGDDSIAGSAAVDIFREQGSLQDQLLTKTHELERAGKSLSDEEQKRAQLLMDTTEHIGQQVLKAAELRQEEESITKTITDRISQESLGQVENLDQKIKNVQTLQVTYTALSPIITQVRDEMEKAANSGSDEQKARAVESVKFAFEQLKTTLDKAGISFDGLEQDAQDLLNRLFNLGNVDFNTLNEQFADIDQDVKSLGADAQVAFNNLRQELMNVEGVDKAGVKKLLDDLKTSLSTTGRLTAEQIQQFRNFGIAVDETGKIIEGFKGKVMTFADGMVALGSILSSFASVLLSIKGLSDIWTNEDLTTGEKVLRTLTTLGMILPMLTRLFDAQNLAKLAALKIDKQQIKTTIAKIAGLNAETVANKGLTAALWSKVAAYMAAHWWVLAIIAVMGIAVGVIVAVTNAYNEEAKAAEAAAEKAAELQKAYSETAQAAKNLKDTISDYSEGVEQINKLKTGTLEYKQAIIEANDKAIELISNYESLAKWAHRNSDGLIIIDQQGFDELIESQMLAVETAQSKWLKAESVASELKEKSDLVNFSRQYQPENINGINWEETSEEIVSAIAEYLKENNLTDLIDEDLSKISGWSSLSEEVQSHIRENIGAYSDMGVQLNNANKAQENLTDAYMEAEYRLRHPEAELGEDGAADTYDLLHESLYETYVAKNLEPSKKREYINDYKAQKQQEYYDTYVKDAGVIAGTGAANANATLTAHSNLTGMGGIEDAKAYAELLKQAYNLDGEVVVEQDSGMDAAWDAFLSFFGAGTGVGYTFTHNGQVIDTQSQSTIYDAIATITAHDSAEQQADIKAPEILDSLTTLMGSLGNLDSEAFRNLLASKGDLAYSGMSQEMAQYIKDNWSTVTNAFTGYAEDIGFWTEMGYESYQDYLAVAKEWIDNRADMSDGASLGLERVTQIQNASNTVEDKVLSGELTAQNAADDADFTGLVNGAKQLAQLYPELTEEAKLLANENLVGTEMWIAALHKVQEQADSIKLDQLIKESDKIESEISGMFKELGEKPNKAQIEAVLLSDEFETKLDQLLDKNYEIDVEIHAQAEQAFESFSTAAEQMRTMASKIGEGYVVAASDIRELNNVFPGIIQGMQDVGDGSVKLNEQVVQNAMNSANAEVQASAYSTIEQLENQASLLRSKQTTYMAMYEAALALSKGEGDAEANTQKIKQGMLEIEALNNQEMTDTKQENAEAVATDSNVQAGIMAQNWDSAYQSAAKSAIEFAKVAVSAAKSAQTGELQVVSGDFGVSYQGRNGQSSEAAKLAELQSAVNEASTADDYAALAQSFLEAAESAGMKANDIEGMIAEIGATGIDLSHLMGNVSTGEGPDGPEKEKSGSDKKDKDYFDFEADKLKLSEEEIERYHEIENALEVIADELEAISKEKDRAFGQKRLALIDKESAALKKQIALQKQYIQEIANNKANDASRMVSQYGATIDTATGNITNYDEIAQAQLNTYNAAYADYIASKNAAVTDYNKNKNSEGADAVYDAAIKAADAAWKTAQDNYSKFKDNLKTYEESVDLLREQEQVLIDLQNQIQDLNYEKLAYKLELEILVNDNELKELDYYFNKMEGDIEKAVEAFGLLKDKMEVTKDSLADYETHVHELEAAYAAGEISQADYIDGLQNCYDSLYENLEALNELDEQMMDYYGDTYDLALEKIEKYTSQLDHLNGVLDHYKSIMSLLGKETDFETMGVILEGQVETTKNSYEAAQSVYNMAKEQKEAAYKELQNAKTDEERELLQKNYDKAVEEFNNAQEEMLSSAEAYGQAIKDALVNSMEQAAKEMEEAMTGAWGSFESLQEQMSLHSERESEFLTTTNKLYETNKMLNQLAQDMEKTDNRAAKSKYAAFAKEIEQLQQKGKLSNLELEIAKAKYSVLQAQIALEEAKNAKSTVRLQRDSEGNFGYVYTADQDKISQAEQDLADAENNLYNIRLDAANEYAEKIVQAKADLAARLKEIDERAAEDAEYREGQYAEDRQRILNEYYQTIGAYSELYGIATSEDARIVDEAWTSTYRDVITDGEEWKKAVTGYTEKITKAFEIWEQRTDVLTDLVGKNLDETKSKVNDVTQASKDLKDELVKEVVPAVSTTLTNVRTLTTAYAAQRTQVLNLAKAYENLAKSIKKKIQAEAQEAIAETKTEDPTPQQPETPKTEEPKVEEPKTEEPAGNKLATASITTQKGVAYAVWNGAWGNGAQRKSQLEEKFGPGAYETYQALVSQHNIASNAKGTGWIKDLGWSVSDPNVIKKLRDTYGPQAFFTGGYTGEWGAEGKLAFLHEKELVLNAEDTENLLTTITILRELMKAIDLNASWASMGIGMLNATGVSNNSQTLEQQVEIHAEFPNATDRHEIEEAFTTLINRASQYANRF